MVWNIGESVAPQMVNVNVNGEFVDEVPATETLGDVVRRFASNAGIATANVFSETRQLEANDSHRSLGALGVSEIDIRTKDQRA